MIVPPNRMGAAQDFALCSGLLRAHIVERVPIEKLAANYGYTTARLRTKLLDHLAASLAALVIEVPPIPVAPPADPLPAPAARIRERVPRPV